MRWLILLVSCAIIHNHATAQTLVEEGDDVDHTRIITPDEEDEYLRGFWRSFSVQPLYRFKQTEWGECSEAITGNFKGYACSDHRAISVILKKLLADNIYTCINKGLAAQEGGGTVADLHIVHNGITGDARHSPKSLHAENRAIDIVSLEMKLADGRVKSFVYEGKTNRTFYTAFRNCWGRTLKAKNGCPYYQGSNILYTGSIGWENKDHQHHLHVSAPHCVSGSYTSLYYQR